MTDPRNLEDVAAKLAARFNALGINADPGLAGSVVIYASDEQAEAFLAAIDPRTAEAQAERQRRMTAAAEQHGSNATAELRRYREALADIDRVYRLRTETPEPKPGPDLATAPLQDAILAVLAELPADSEGLTSFMITGRLSRAGRSVSENDVTWALNAMLGRREITFRDPAGESNLMRWVLARKAAIR